MSPRLIGLLSTEVGGLSSGLVATLAQGDLMHARHCIRLGMEVYEFRRKKRMTHRMARQELSAMEQGARVATFQRSQGFQFAVQKHQGRARLAVNEAGLDSPVRLETHEPRTSVSSSIWRYENEARSALRPSVDRTSPNRSRS